MPDNKEILSKYLPENTISAALQWLQKSNVQLKITRARNSKLGDYRPPLRQPYHRISVNHDLNKYHFFLTFVHEYAHLKTWEKYKNRVKPHGPEWKIRFRELMQPFLNPSIFPADLLPIIKNYLENPGASSSNTNLINAFRKYDTGKSYFTVEDIPNNSIFMTKNGMIFKKGDKLRKRYKCQRMDNKRMYLVSSIAEAVPVE